MSTKRSVVLKGCPEVTEEGVASATIHPGYLTKGVSSVAPASTTHKQAFTLALEREELGAGIDDSKQGVGTISASYASGDQVKIGAFDAGDEATVYVASGQNITEDDYLTSAGDGTFAETATVADFMCRAMETLGAVTTLTALRVQVV